MYESAWPNISAICLVSIVRDGSKTNLNMFIMQSESQASKIQIKNDSD